MPCGTGPGSPLAQGPSGRGPGRGGHATRRDALGLAPRAVGVPESLEFIAPGPSFAVPESVMLAALVGAAPATAPERVVSRAITPRAFISSSSPEVTHLKAGEG